MSGSKAWLSSVLEEVPRVLSTAIDGESLSNLF